MTKEELTDGDEVQHRSGGPKMIYIGESQYGEALCEWFEGRNPRRETFSYSALKNYEAPPMFGTVNRV